MSSNMDGPVKISSSTVMKTFFLKRQLVLEKTLDQEINHEGLVASGGPLGGTCLEEKSAADFSQTKLYDSAAVSSKNRMIEVPTMSKKMNLRLPCMTWWLKCVSFLWFLSVMTIVNGAGGKLDKKKYALIFDNFLIFFPILSNENLFQLFFLNTSS